MAQAAVAACPAPVSLSPDFGIARVTDGDTVVLSTEQRLRLVGFDTPELSAKDWRKPFALAAKAAVEQHLPESTQVTPWPAATDRYGRLLGNLWLGDHYLAEDLVARGLALAVTVPPQLQLSDCLRAIEVRARRAGHGLWGTGRLPQSIAAEEDLGGFQVLQGAVSAIASNRRAQTVILDGVLRLQLVEGMPALEVGDEVEVRGWVTRSRASHREQTPWTLRIQHPTNLARRWVD